MATYILKFKSLSSMLCALGVRLTTDMATHEIHSASTEYTLGYPGVYSVLASGPENSPLTMLSRNFFTIYTISSRQEA